MSERTYNLLQLLIVVVGLQVPLYFLAKEIGDDEVAKTTLGLILSFLGLVALRVVFKWNAIANYFKQFTITKKGED